MAALFLTSRACFAEIETFSVPAPGGYTVPSYAAEEAEGEPKAEEEGVTEEAAKEAAAKKPPVKENMQQYILSRLHTHVDTTMSYNDNVYLLHKKTGDVVTTVRPGLSFLIGDKDLRVNGKPTSYFEADAGYTSDCYIREKLNHNNPYASVTLQGAGAHYRVSAGNYFVKAQKPTQSLSAGRSGLVGYQLNVTSAKFEYDFKKAGVKIEYNRRQLDYKGYPFRDNNSVVRQGVNTTLSVSPPITPKTTYFFEYDYGTWVYDYAPSNLGNFTEHYFWLGGKGKLLKKLYWQFKAGKLMRYSYVTPAKYKDAFVFSGDLYYRYSKKLVFALRFSRDQDPATNRSLGFNTGYNLLASGIYDYSDKLRFTGGAKYMYDGYKTAGTHDNTYGPFARLDYKVNKAISIGLEYNYTRRDTTRANAKYNNSNIIANMKMEF